MNILVACDKFKGSLSADKVSQAISIGLKHQYPDSSIISCSMADGGDGSLAVIQSHLNTEMVSVNTKDAIDRPITTQYFIHDQTAYIELAAASGLAQLEPEFRDPMLTSSFGTGILIKDALKKGLKHIVLFLGGSSSNDAGLGITEALGFNYFDFNNHQLTGIGKNLSSIQRIQAPDNLPEFQLNILCDVTNPMYGPNGAAHIYAGQKGADQKTIDLLDKGLNNIAKVIEKYSGKYIADIPGAGAAGGVAGGLVGLLNGNIQNGFQAIAKISNLNEKIKSADLVISGEGQLDDQSLNGKVVGEIDKLCGELNKKLVVLVGKNALTPSQIKQTNIHQVFEILSLTNEKEAMLNPEKYLTILAKSI